MPKLNNFFNSLVRVASTRITWRDVFNFFMPRITPLELNRQIMHGAPRPKFSNLELELLEVAEGDYSLVREALRLAHPQHVVKHSDFAKFIRAKKSLKSPDASKRQDAESTINRINNEYRVNQPY